MANIAFIDGAGATGYIKADGAGSGGDPYVTRRAIEEAIADDAAFTAGTSRVLPIGGTYQATVDLIDANDAGAMRLSQRRAVIVRPDFSVLNLSSGTPVPSGSDITNTAGGAIVAGDLEIRDTSNHDFVIPMLISGYQDLGIQVTANTAYDQNLTVVVYGRRTPAQIVATVLSVTLTAGTTFFAIGAGAVGQGGFAGGAAIVNSNWYNVPLLSAPMPYWGLRFSAVGTPTAGTLTVGIARS